MSLRKYQYDVFMAEAGSSSTARALFGSPRRIVNKRFVIVLILVIVAVAIAVGVALGVTLRKNKKSVESITEGQKENLVKTTFPPLHEADWIRAPCKPRHNITCPWSSPPLLLVSLDGFRADYLQRHITPAINKLKTCGVHTPYMRATYPTLTFPNHYTTVTGLYPESHGIVGNSMYDPNINKLFTLSSDEKYNPKWWKGEPLWITAKKQKKKTASYFWVGSDVNISGIQPDTWHKYNGSVPFEHRVDTVLQWLEMNTSRPDFTTLYFNEPDHTAHGYGPDSTQENDKIKEVDRMIHRLMNGLYQKELHTCVNVIILADHGMADTSCNRQVALSKYKVKDTKALIFTGAMGRIFTRYKKRSTSSNTVILTNPVVSVDDLHCKNIHLKAFTADSIPRRHHYANSDRIGDIVIDVEDRWLVSTVKKSSCLHGNHGYDNIYKSMHALFLAHGPSFKENYAAAPFENIELYNLMSDLLGITPAPNNGTQGSLRHLLKKQPITTIKSNKFDYKSYSQDSFSAPICMCDPTTLPKLEIGNGQNKDTFLLMPKLTEDVSVYLIHREVRRITSYSTIYHGPAWSSSFYSSTQRPGSFVQTISCLIPDLKVTDEAKYCNNYSNMKSEFILSTLLPQVNYTAFTSDVVPMYKKFQKDIWFYIWDLVESFLDDSQLHVNAGPIYDYNNDGLWEGVINETQYVSDKSSVPVPTHFYIILLKCADAQCETHKIQSFIIPHLEEIPNCLSKVDYLKDNVARIRDIELLTGLEFLTDLNDDISLSMRTYLHEEIWSSRLTSKWIDQQCDKSPQKQCPWSSNPVLLVSLDGFRADYINRNFTPVIKKLSQCGVHTPYMRSSFPTRTFPNHYTIVTGLYPESHGIVGNKMYDPEIGEEFKMSGSTAFNPAWWGGEPIWNTVQKFGKKSAAYFWVGSDKNISGHYPNEWKRYSGNVPFQDRVDTVIEWLSRPDDSRPDMILLYFNEPDHTAHYDGPNSLAENNVLASMDKIIERLMDGLYHKNIHDCVNIIVVADHGMTETSCDRQVLLDGMVNISKILTYGGPFGKIDRHFHKQSKVGIQPVSKEYTVDEILEDIECGSDHYKVYRKETTPIRYHYTNNKRIGDILIDVQDEWLVYDYKRSYCLKGNHGYDNMYKTMHALFLAHGPGFKKDVKVEPFENIELYNLMSALLEVTPAPNNGTWGSLHHLLKEEPSVLLNVSSSFAYKTTTLSDKVTDLIPAKSCICNNGHNLTTQDIVSWNNNTKKRFPFGVPILKVDDKIKMLPQKYHVVFYSETKRLPLISSTVRGLPGFENHSPKPLSCIVEDPRVPSDVQSLCSELENSTDIVQSPLYEAGDGVYTATELVPMYRGFKMGIWKHLTTSVNTYLDNLYFYPFHIITGPIFDYNHDGRWEGLINETKYVNEDNKIPMPSHFFMTVVKCRLHSCSLEGLDVFSVILPHTPQIPNCVSPSVIHGDKPLQKYIEHNMVRVKDIELLTGFDILTDLNYTASARLKTKMPHLWWSEGDSTKTPSCSSAFSTKCPENYQPLLLISLDGFRAEYLLKKQTPAIQLLSQCGVSASYMRSVYPTKTFPNHYSIVTGLYPESHGIIDNNMYDEKIDGVFSIGGKNSSDPRWWHGEPIWVTAKKQNLKTASYFWVGSEIEGKTPNYYEKYNNYVPYDARVKQVLEWMDKPEGERPELITLYFDQPDHEGHIVGPDSIKLNEALEKVDQAIASLLDGLETRGLLGCVNMMIIADHGMAQKSCNHSIHLNNYIDSKNFGNMFIYEGPFGRISTHYRYSRTGRPKVTHPKKMSRKSKSGTNTKLSDDLENAVENVYSFFSRESQLGNIMIGIHKVVQRVSAALKIPQTTIRDVLRRKENACVMEVVESVHDSAIKNAPPPSKSRGRPCKFDSFDEAVIRQTIHDMYRNQQYVSLDLLRKKLHLKGMNITRSTLYNLLKKIGFRFRKNGIGKSFVNERPDVIAHRHSYLREIKKYRESGWDIVYTDETWLNANHTCKGEWSENRHGADCKDCGRYVPSGKGKRLIIVDAGSAKHGFIDGANLTFISKTKTGDYHDEMNATNFLCWFKNQLLKNLTEPSVIVLDNATYHNVLTEETKCPTLRDRRETIVSWLNDHNILFDSSFIKEELIELVKRNKPEPVYETDKMAMMHGHFVMRLPVKHCELNPIELMWAELKCGVARRNNTFKISDVRDLFVEVRKSIGVESWSKAVQHVITIENQFWETDGVREQSVEPVSFSLIDSDDADSSSDCSSDISSSSEVVSDDCVTDDLDSESVCIVCRSAFPPGPRKSKQDFIKWAQCDYCEGWVHLKYCTKAVDVSRKEAFSCPSCSSKLRNIEPES